MSLSYCEGVTTFLGSSVPACVQKLSALLSQNDTKLKVPAPTCAPLIPREREVGRTSPRVPLALMRSPTNPTSYMARRDAALV